MEELTVKQALEQGYTHYGFKDREWQSVSKLHDNVFEELDEHEYEEVVLFEKSFNVLHTSEQDVSEIIAESVSYNYSQECASDEDNVYSDIIDLDFSGIVKQINDKMKDHKYWMITDIKLVRDE